MSPCASAFSHVSVYMIECLPGNLCSSEIDCRKVTCEHLNAVRICKLWATWPSRPICQIETQKQPPVYFSNELAQLTTTTTCTNAHYISFESHSYWLNGSWNYSNRLVRVFRVFHRTPPIIRRLYCASALACVCVFETCTSDFTNAFINLHSKQL